jgi:hypothetical protein
VITTENYIKKFDLRTLVASANDIVEEAINEMEEVVMKSGHYAWGRRRDQKKKKGWGRDEKPSLLP